MTFEKWLKDQRNRDDQIGDLSQDFISSRYKTFKEFIKRYPMCDDSQKAYKKSLREYKKEYKKEYERNNVKKWIKVENKLPSESEVILAINNNLPNHSRLVEYACYIGNNFYYDSSMSYDKVIKIEGITHWMPLPERPK